MGGDFRMKICCQRILACY